MSTASELVQQIDDSGIDYRRSERLYTGTDVLDRIGFTNYYLYIRSTQLDIDGSHEYVEEIYKLKDGSYLALRFCRSLTENQDYSGFYEAQEVTPVVVQTTRYDGIGRGVSL